MFDSDPYDEYVETINKLMASSTTIKLAEAHFSKQQSNKKVNGSVKLEDVPDRKAHIDLAAG